MRKKLSFSFMIAIMIMFLSTVSVSAHSSFSAISMNVKNDSTGKILRGLLYMPEVKAGEKIPLVITAHELGSNYARRWPCIRRSTRE